MSRHDRDAVSLMGGLLLVLIAGTFLVGDLTSVDVDGRWIAPAVLILVGLAGVLASLRPRSAAGPVAGPAPDGDRRGVDPDDDRLPSQDGEQAPDDLSPTSVLLSSSPEVSTEPPTGPRTGSPAAAPDGGPPDR